ncbi:alpha-L-rhamnosidase [Streptomyces griseiscabiei]|uniref:alpha-L-rhamnosidase n=1 Tax=Streptomyces griseiscabiei TaxID=2993540 RepID=A0ABU4L1T4_9ACTN|nr:alpha-L-rhamnosidase [Streptomyces griseiscabiei]MBZ3906063.1 family 78 glycoside hydrolase catalytic domain [Streptomyces griseiscabiei]MDX2909697.1 family 78 glycoside hydrolase catalytic domain [Streptomyces griseiscabiei]
MASGTSAAAEPSRRPHGSPVLGLTVEHRTDPLGVDADRPRFGWRTESATRGRRQGEYRILVATSPDRLTADRADVWDSGPVRSSNSVAVPYAGEPLRPSTRYHWTVAVRDTEGRPTGTAAPSSFETGLLSTDGVTGWDGAQWIGMRGKTPGSPGAPMLRTETPLRGPVREARLYVSALGVYDVYVSGHRVTVEQDGAPTVELLPPGWTNYDTRVDYLTYDVTRLVAREPVVTLAAVLGNGWYNGRVSEGSTYYTKDGNELALKAKLLIRYADGTAQSLVTGTDGGWKATDTGPYRSDDLYDGQTYDARRELPNWTAHGFDDTAWSDVTRVAFEDRYPDVRLTAYPGESARFVDRWDLRPRSVTVVTGVTGQEDSPHGRGRVVVDPARTVTDPAKAATAPVTLGSGETAVYDLGQNMVGVARCTVRGPAGARVEFRFAEMLNDDSAGADGPEGSVYRANLRSAEATSTYILKGDPQGETHQDTLTFYGFRHVSVTTSRTVTLTGLTGKVATSAVRETGTFTTNDPDVNQLASNIRWGQRGNYLWVPTDCPQRDERLGWTGDTQVFATTGLYNADAAVFLGHFQDTVVDSQTVYGADKAQYTGVAPGGRYNFPGGGSGWADCGVVLPWTLWQMTGDTTVVERNWPSMTRYLDWIRRQTGDTYAGQGSLTGDWLAPQQTSAQLMSDVYYGYSARLMASMARGTGRTAEAEEYERLFGHIKRAFIAKYLSTDGGRITVRSGLGEASPIEPGSDPDQRTEDNTQTALLWVLKLGFYETQAQRRALVGHLADNIGNDAAHRAAHPDSVRVRHAENTLSVGFLGVNVLAPILTDEGRADLAYRLLYQDALPSWLFSVRNGATTVWERWNSYSEGAGFGPVGMNSFNHYAYGAIMEWMYAYMAGIAPDPAGPGFQRFLLRPHLDPTGRITRVSGTYVSPYGEIRSAWETDSGGRTLAYEAVVPANSEATLRLPAASADAVREGRTPLARVDGVRFLGHADGVASYRLPSGRYRLTADLR